MNNFRRASFCFPSKNINIKPTKTPEHPRFVSEPATYKPKHRGYTIYYIQNEIVQSTFLARYTTFQYKIIIFFVQGTNVIGAASNIFSKHIKVLCGVQTVLEQILQNVAQMSQSFCAVQHAFFGTECKVVLYKVHFDFGQGTTFAFIAYEIFLPRIQNFLCNVEIVFAQSTILVVQSIHGHCAKIFY